MVGFTNPNALKKTGSVADRESRKEQYFADNLAELSKGLGRTPGVEAEIKDMWEAYNKEVWWNPKQFK